MDILSSPYFTRRVRKVVKNNSNFVASIDRTLTFFKKSPHHPSLRLHKLTGTAGDAWSISVNRSIRIVFRYIPHGILLTNIGSHDEVY